jgi:hypothetical protein
LGGITVLVLLAFGVVFLIFLATLALVFLGTAIPLVILGVRRFRGHRSRGSKIAMIVLGILCGLSFVILAALTVLLVVPAGSS